MQYFTHDYSCNTQYYFFQNQFEHGVNLLGKTAFVNWPFHTLAMISRVTDGYQKIKTRYNHLTAANTRTEIVQVPVANEEMEAYEKEVKETQTM